MREKGGRVQRSGRCSEQGERQVRDGSERRDEGKGGGGEGQPIRETQKGRRRMRRKHM